MFLCIGYTEKKEEETAAAAHQEAMAGIEDPDAPAIAPIPEEPSSETATSSSDPPGKKARTESWKALRNPAREVIGDGDTQALAPVDEAGAIVSSRCQYFSVTPLTGGSP